MTGDERIQDTMEVRKIPMRMAPLTWYIIKRVVKILKHTVERDERKRRRGNVEDIPSQEGPKPHRRVPKEPSRAVSLQA